MKETSHFSMTRSYQCDMHGIFPMSMDWFGIGVGLGFCVVLCLSTVDVVSNICYFEVGVLLQAGVRRYDLYGLDYARTTLM